MIEVVLSEDVEKSSRKVNSKYIQLGPELFTFAIIIGINVAI